MSRASDRDAASSALLSNRINLYQLFNGRLQWRGDEPLQKERDLQRLFEDNLSELMGLEFLDSEYPTGSTHGGRIDTLALDELNRPVVIEYKRNKDENVINQGLDYLHWLEGAQARDRIRALIHRKLGDRPIDFEGAWLLCVAWQFPRRDLVAAGYSQKRIELCKYGYYGDGLLATELIYAAPEEDDRNAGSSDSFPVIENVEATLLDEPLSDISGVSGWEKASPALRALFRELDAAALSLGEDVQRTPRKGWVAYKGMSKKDYNIFAVRFRTRDDCLHIHAAVNPGEVELEQGFTEYDEKMTMQSLYRCPLKIIICDRNSLERSKPFLFRAYENYLGGEHLRWDFVSPDFGQTSGWRSASLELRALFMQLHDYVLTLVPDVQVLPSSHRIAFKGNFFILAVYVRSRSNELHAYASVDPATVQLKPGFTRDTEGWPLSHNRLEIIIRDSNTLDQAKSYIAQAVKNDLRGEPFDWAKMQRAGS